jgi:hypothetical protein
VLGAATAFPGAAPKQCRAYKSHARSAILCHSHSPSPFALFVRSSLFYISAFYSAFLHQTKHNKMKFTVAAVTVVAAAATSAAARKITVHNKCTTTIWPGMYTDMHVAGNVMPDHPTGYASLKIHERGR